MANGNIHGGDGMKHDDKVRENDDGEIEIEISDHEKRKLVEAATVCNQDAPPGKRPFF